MHSRLTNTLSFVLVKLSLKTKKKSGDQIWSGGVCEQACSHHLILILYSDCLNSNQLPPNTRLEAHTTVDAREGSKGEPRNTGVCSTPISHISCWCLEFSTP